MKTVIHYKCEKCGAVFDTPSAALACEAKYYNLWVPVNTGLFPEEQEAVQVTYLGYNDHKPHCDAFAFLENGKWYWSLDEGDVKVPIIAWKQTGEAYEGKI